MPGLLRRVLAGGRADGVRQAGAARVADRVPAESVRPAGGAQSAGAGRALVSAPSRLDRLAGAGGGARRPGRARLAAGVARVAGRRGLRVGTVLAVLAGLVLARPVVAGRILAGPVLVGGGLAVHPGHTARAVLAGRVLAGGARLVLPAARGGRSGVVLPGRVLAGQAGLVRPGPLLVGRVAGRRAEDLRLLGQLGLGLRTARGHSVGTPVRVARRGA